MKYSKSSYINALQQLAALRDSVPESERFAIEFISEAVAEKCSRDYPLTHGDWIRGMGDDDLASFLAEVENRRAACGSGAVWNGSAHAFQWLNQPIEDTPHD